jgi:glycosyltransferase involved in cell wall biosynthesis
MPRVLHIYKDYYPPVLGGIEKHINLVCNGIADQFDVRVLVANRARGTARETIGEIPVVKASCWGRLASAPVCPSFPRLIKEWPADILHFHLPNPTGDLAWMLSRPQGKIAITYHSDIVRQKWAMAAYGPFLRRFLRRADAIMPTSPNYIESSPWLREVREKCTVVPLGIDLSTFADSPERQTRAGEIRRRYGKPIVVFVGVLRYYKGLRFLIEAMKDLDAACLIIGNGPERPQLAAQIPDSSSTEKIFLLGDLDDSTLADHLQAADLFCLPAHLRAEAYGLCQIEAMACGLPVVSCNLDTGVPYVNLDGETGLLCRPADPASLQAALRRLLDDEALRRSLGENARRRALDQFSSSLMIDRVKQVYRALLEERPMPKFD